jgi:hypothetical protein
MVVILRSGVRLPVGDAVAWWALFEQATQVLGQALDNSPITEAVGAWCVNSVCPGWDHRVLPVTTVRVGCQG